MLLIGLRLISNHLFISSNWFPITDFSDLGYTFLVPWYYYWALIIGCEIVLMALFANKSHLHIVSRCWGYFSEKLKLHFLTIPIKIQQNWSWQNWNVVCGRRCPVFYLLYCDNMYAERHSETWKDAIYQPQLLQLKDSRVRFYTLDFAILQIGSFS